MSSYQYTPQEIRQKVKDLLTEDLGIMEYRASSDPVVPTAQKRSDHDKSYSVLVSASQSDIGPRDSSGDRYVTYTISITLLTTTVNKGKLDALLDNLYLFVDKVHKALMSELADAFGCVSFEFESMSLPRKSDAEYEIDLTYTTIAEWLKE